MPTIESLFADTSYDLELEKLKNKIQKLYKDLLVKTFKASKPTGTSEELESFLEKNALEFKDSESFDEDSEELESMLDLLLQSEDLEKVTEKEYSDITVETGKELKSKSKDTPFETKTKSLKFPTGGLFTPKDKRIHNVTRPLKTPIGKIKRVANDSPKVETQQLSDIWDEERKKLLSLVQKRNKEHGVIL